MSLYRRNTRPTLVERHHAFLRLEEINELIAILQLAYEETQNEKVWRVLSILEKAKQRQLSLEEIYREDEIREFWSNPGLWPHAVRVWMMEYRDREL